METLQKVKQDIDYAIEAIKLTLKDFQEEIEFAFLKGSASKVIETTIDYVPVVSDIDVHIKFSNKFPGSGPQALDKAIKFALSYENHFKTIHQRYVHLPRIQFMDLERLISSGFYTPPHVNELELLQGNFSPDFSDITSIPENQIQDTDLQRIRKDHEFLQNYPLSVYDRSGLDWWIILRQLNWRVSPAPFRLLTQKDESPYEIWKLNRTKVVQKLRAHGYDDIASNYTSYYITAWKQFNNDFTNSTLYGDMLRHGYQVIYDIVSLFS